MTQSTPTPYLIWHGARLALTGAEAEALRARGLVVRPLPEHAPEAHRSADGRGLDGVHAELARLRSRPALDAALFEVAYVLAVPRGGRTLYLDEVGAFTDEPELALEFTPEGRHAYEADGSFASHEGAEWHQRLGDRISPLPEPADPPPALPPDPAHPARSREEVEALKRTWREDPCWDVGATPGYEAHRAELAAYRAAAQGGTPADPPRTDGRRP